MMGVMVATVTNIKDPDKLGRIKVKYQHLSATEETDWIRVASVWAGKDRGMLVMPDLKDEVLIAFEMGDINRPIVIGQLWSKPNKLPAEVDPKNNTKVLKSRCGHTVTFDDTDGKEKFTIIDKGKKSMIVIDSKEKKITIETEQDMDIKAEKGKLSIKAKEIEVKAEKTFKLDAEEITAKSTKDLKLEGKPVEMKSGSKVTVQGSADVIVKGSQIKLN